MTPTSEIPEELHGTLRRARRLEWWNIGWTISIVTVMGLAMGGSQAMRTAWVEDMLGLIPPILFLVTTRLEMKPPTVRFPFGFDRAHSLGFFAAAVALAALGLLLLRDAVTTLVSGEHVTVGSVFVFGEQVWLGWFMLAAQAYSIVPPLIIGRMELPLAETLQDKLLHTDALMNKANWMTGAAGMFGVAGLGLGWWWADSLAAGLIALDIVGDGVKAFRTATAELIDGAPRAIDGDALAADAKALRRALEAAYPEGDVRLRETGRRIQAQIEGVAAPASLDPRDHWPGDPERAWRIERISFVPPSDQAGGDSGRQK